MLDEFFRAVKVGYDDLSKRHHWLAVVLFALVGLLLIWIGLALEPAFELGQRAFAQCLFGTPPDGNWGAWPWALLQLLLPLLFFSVALLALWWRYRRRTVQTVTKFGVPAPHRGLIVMLSRYALREERSVCEQLNIPKDAAALERLLADQVPGAHQDLRRKVFGTSWGPLWAAVEHHRWKLETCWIVCTPGTEGSAPLYGIAEKLVAHIALRPVACHRVVTNNAYDVSQIVPVVDDLYRGLKVPLDVDDVIADFTGGTAAMTAGMILATLDRRRKVEYLRQDCPLMVGPPEARRDVTADELLEQGALVLVNTGPELVRIAA